MQALFAAGFLAVAADAPPGAEGGGTEPPKEEAKPPRSKRGEGLPGWEKPPPPPPEAPVETSKEPPKETPPVAPEKPPVATPPVEGPRGTPETPARPVEGPAEPPKEPPPVERPPVAANEEALRKRALETLATAKEGKDRYEACVVLTLFDDDESAAALRKVLREDADDAVRVAAAFALGKMGRQDAAPDIEAALAEGKSPYLRVTAAAQLGFLGCREGTPALVRALSDPDTEVRASAATALGRMRVAEALEPLRGLLEDGEPQVRAEATAALGRIEDDRVVEPLLGRLRDGDPRVRVQALRALKRRPDPGVTAALVAIERDADVGVRSALMDAFGAERFGEPEARRILLSGLSDVEPAVRAAAISALGETHDAEAGRRIADRLSRKAEADAGVRAAAAAALAKFRDLKEAGDALALAAGDPDDQVRAVSASSFGWFPEEIALPAMRRALRDRERDVRLGAATVLARFRDRPEVKEALEAFERREAIEAAAGNRRTFLDDDTF